MLIHLKNTTMCFALGIFISTAHAGLTAQELAVGSVLNNTQIAQANAGKPVNVGQLAVRVLPVVSTVQGQTNNTVKAAGVDLAPITKVINQQGVVGESRNEVVLSGVPTDQARAKVAGFSAKAVSVKYFDSTQITVLRFANFGDAVAARDALQKALPGAAVSLPIRFSESKLR